MSNRPAFEIEGVLAIGAFLLFAAYGVMLMFVSIPPNNKDYALAILVALIAIVKDTFGRYFQATKGSQEQRKDSAEVARTLAETAAVVATAAAAAPPPPAPGTANIQAAPDVEVEVTSTPQA